MIIPAVSLWMEPWSPHLVHSSCQISLGKRFFLMLECEWWFHPQEPVAQLPIPGEPVCQVSLLNLNNLRALSELRYQNSFIWKKQELAVELLMRVPFTSLHPRDARYVPSTLIWFKNKPMFAYKAPINDGFTPLTLHNGYAWLSLCLQAEAWQSTAGADATLLLFSCLSVTPDPLWADPWPPCIMDPHFRYRVHGRNSKTGVSEQSAAQTNRSVQAWCQCKSIYRNKIYVTDLPQKIFQSSKK